MSRLSDENYWEDLELRLTRLPSRIVSALLVRMALRFWPSVRSIYGQVFPESHDDEEYLREILEDEGDYIRHVSAQVVPMFGMTTALWTLVRYDVPIDKRISKLLLTLRDQIAKFLLHFFLGPSDRYALGFACIMAYSHVTKKRGITLDDVVGMLSEACYALDNGYGVGEDLLDALEEDLSFATGEKDVSVPELLDLRLWHRYGMPYELEEAWTEVSTGLAVLFEDYDWDVWIDWYAAREVPQRLRPCFSPPIEALERERAFLDEALWRSAPLWRLRADRWCSYQLMKLFDFDRLSLVRHRWLMKLPIWSDTFPDPGKVNRAIRQAIRRHCPEAQNGLS